MIDKMMNRVVAVGVFLVTAFVYLKTLSVTVVFWDVGEFCAASRLLQVPHPPGAPLFVLVARIVSLIPFLPDIAARMHAVSAIGSALGVMFLYLAAVKLISRFRPITTSFDRVIVFGSSAIGALALAFSTTYWDNSIEAEVYGLAMFFVSICLWLALRWWERADEPRNERYFLLIAYLLGLSTGVHILALLQVIPILMIYYFRHYEFNRKSFLKFSAVALAIFFVIYPGIVQFLPSLLDGDFKGFKSDVLPFVPLALVIVALYGVYRTIRTKHKMLHLACFSFLFIVLGYSTYSVVLIRSNVTNLAMKENEPKDLASLTAYITREQYGDVPLLKGESWDNDLQGYREKWFPRRPSHEAMHEATRVNYTSDWDFFWRYQISHMYIRYLLWNFSGAEGDWADARANIFPLNPIGNIVMKFLFKTSPFGGEARDSTFLIPVLLVLFGFFYHFNKDWKMGFVLLTMFTIMGVVLDLYQNQQDPQPRERDYFYVGAYYAMAIWIAVGLTGIISVIRKYLHQESLFKTAASGVLAVAAFTVPVNLARINWFEHDRSQNYSAWDYSYNLLQSCEPNAILFTNGDNDTFPLWYLQDVERVRRDIRIVNLSLVNTSWYIHQLKNEMPYGTQKVPISLTDDQIAHIGPVRWTTRQVDLLVPRDVLHRYNVVDSTIQRTGKITYTIKATPWQENISILRVQDMMVRDIIMTNKWERPIYFAVTVSPDAKIGLDNYMKMQGLAWKLVPAKFDSPEGALDKEVMEANVLAKNITPSTGPQHGYIYRNLNNPHVYYDENVQRLVMNYRAGFMRLAFNELRANNKEKAKQIMQQLEATVPLNVVPIRDWVFTARMMNIFLQLADSTDFKKYSDVVERTCLDIINSNNADVSSEDNPYIYLLSIYDARKDYQSAIDLLNRLSGYYPDDKSIKSRIQFYQNQLKGGAIADTATSR